MKRKLVMFIGKQGYNNLVRGQLFELYILPDELRVLVHNEDGTNKRFMTYKTVERLKEHFKRVQ